MRVLLVSTYELGHQPLHLAAPAAALRAAGHEVRTLDTSVEAWDRVPVDWADGVAFSVPMHTAMRLARGVVDGIRAHRHDVPIALYGLYAHVGRTDGASWSAFTGEYESRLMAWAAGDHAGASVDLTRGAFHVPARHLLPPLDRYARLAIGEETRTVGAVEASHGCAHKCRHCPVPVVYNGRVRPVGDDVVLADIAQLAGMGAQHITFADPDFLNMPAYARRVIDAMHTEFPDLTFDITTKVEHILRYRNVWRDFSAAGCLFVVSAVESVNDDILGVLDKGHTAADASQAIIALRAAGIEMRPSFLPFTPWTARAGLVALCAFIAAHDLVGNVDPVQLSIRLLLPDGSLLLRHCATTGYDANALSFTWASDLDALQRELAALVEASVDEPNEETFARLAAVIGADLRNVAVISQGPSGPRPRLTEPWFCCAEPTENQFLRAGGNR